MQIWQQANTSWPSFVNALDVLRKPSCVRNCCTMKETDESTDSEETT